MNTLFLESYGSSNSFDMINFQSDIIDLQSEISQLKETLLINDFKVFKEGLEYTTEKIQSINESIGDKVAKVVAKGKELISYINTLKVKYSNNKIPENVGKTLETEHKKMMNAFEVYKQDPSKENSNKLRDQISTSKKVIKALKLNSSIKNEAKNKTSDYEDILNFSVKSFLASVVLAIGNILTLISGMTGLSILLALASNIALYISVITFMMGVVVFFVNKSNS